MKGFKTIAFGFLLAIVPSGLDYLAGIDWTKIVDPTLASIISGAIIIALRFKTDTKVLKKE